MLLTETKNHFSKLYLGLPFDKFMEEHGIMPLFNSEFTEKGWKICDDPDKKINISYNQLRIIADSLARYINNQYLMKHDEIYIYGVPKGGIIPALLLFNALKNEKYQITDDVKKAHIIIDDVLDSGKTKLQYTSQNPTAKFYAFFTKPSNWVVFPWENSSEGSIEDAYIRLSQYYNIPEEKFEEFKKDVSEYISDNVWI